MTDEKGKTVDRIELESMDDSIGLFGVFDENLAVFEEEIGVKIRIHSDGIAIEGDEDQVSLCRTVLEKLLDMQRKGEPINRGRIRYAIDIAKDGNAELISQIMGDVVALTNRGKQIKCKTLGQKKYIQALKSHELSSASVPRARAKHTLPSRWLSLRSRIKRSSASFSRVRQWRQAKSWASFRAICRTRSIRTSDRCTTHCRSSSGWKPINSSWSAARSKWRLSRTCADAR